MLPLMLISIVDEGLLPFLVNIKVVVLYIMLKIGRKVINKN